MSETSYDFLAGETLLIDKPVNWTSFQVVNKIRWLIKHRLGIKKIKVGHAGTLDPLATGLLIICTGKSTKKIHVIQDELKEYTGEITLGATTPSFDLETEINQKFDVSGITDDAILVTAEGFLGEQLQTPPIFSAKKIDGKKGYQYARKGQQVAMRQSMIHIHEFKIETIALPAISFRIVCSKGTYIRSIANDFGKRLENGGHLTSLRRTKIGENEVENALEIDAFEECLKNTPQFN